MTPLGYHSIHRHHDDHHPNLHHHLHMSHGVNLSPAAADAGGHGGRSSRGRMPFFFGPHDDHTQLAFESAMLHPSTSFSSSAAGSEMLQAEDAEARQALYNMQGAAAAQEESAAEDEMMMLEGGAQAYVDKKGRRLGFEQVKALEKAFEVENRLEPERKVRLAGQLGLQPRQVAVWFQNRRARWKTKQMERDFGVLRSKFEALKADRDKLLSEKEKLQLELNKLKGHEIKEGHPGMQTTSEDQILNSPTTLVASCSVNTDHETGGVVELQDDHGSNNTTVVAPLSFHNNQDMVEEPTKVTRASTTTANPHGVSSHLFRVQHVQMLRTDQQNESLSSTDEYNSDDGGAIVDSPTSNTSLNRVNEVDQNGDASIINNNQQHALLNNHHWRLPSNPCLELAHTRPNTINIKNEAIWEGDQLPHPDVNNCVHFINLPSEWYNW